MAISVQQKLGAEALGGEVQPGEFEPGRRHGPDVRLKGLDRLRRVPALRQTLRAADLRFAPDEAAANRTDDEHDGAGRSGTPPTSESTRESASESGSGSDY